MFFVFLWQCQFDRGFGSAGFLSHISCLLCLLGCMNESDQNIAGPAIPKNQNITGLLGSLLPAEHFAIFGCLGSCVHLDFTRPEAENAMGTSRKIWRLLDLEHIMLFMLNFVDTSTLKKEKFLKQSRVGQLAPLVSGVHIRCLLMCL